MEVTSKVQTPNALAGSNSNIVRAPSCWPVPSRPSFFFYLALGWDFPSTHNS